MPAESVAAARQSETAKTMHVGVVCWRNGDELSSVIADTVADLGHHTVGFRFDAPLPQGLDAVLAIGPFGSLVPLANQLLKRPISLRPAFALWMTEQIWSPRFPIRLAEVLSRARSGADRLAFRQPGGWSRPLLKLLTAKGFRFRHYGDLHWLRGAGLLTVLAMPSRWNADFLKARGIESIVAYVGSHPSWFAELDVPRDIPVLWIGSHGSKRRRRALHQLRLELQRRGVEMLVIDGIENPPVYGRQRAELLSRTKIVVNLVRQPWDSNALRYYLTAPNRALIVSEPTLDHTPFVDGLHLRHVPFDQMADTICHYLANEAARLQIVERAYGLVSTELTMANSVAAILSRVAEIRGRAAA